MKKTKLKKTKIRYGIPDDCIVKRRAVVRCGCTHPGERTALLAIRFFNQDTRYDGKCLKCGKYYYHIL